MYSRLIGHSNSRRFPTGVDTVRLLLPFKVNGSLPNFRVKQTVQAGNVLYIDSGELIVGRASLWQDGNRNLRVRIARARIVAGPVMCWLEFNPARLLRGSNAQAVDQTELEEALRRAEEELRAQGLLVNFQSSKISRIDITRDIHLPRPVDHYWPLLHRIDTPYNSLGRNWETGMWRGGKGLQLCLYDKNAEMQQRSDGTARYESELPGPNTMRIEWRLRNTHAVRYHLKTNAMSEFMPRFSMLTDKMDTFLSKSLFQERLPTCTHIPAVRTYVGRLNEWTALFESVGADKKHVKQLLAIHAYDHMIDQIGWEAADGLLRTSFAEAASSLTTLRRDLRSWRLLYLRSPHGVPYAQLYIELHRAVFAQWSHDDDFVGAALPFIPLKDMPGPPDQKPPSKRGRRRK